MEAPLQANYQRGVAQTFLVGAAVLALVTGVIVVFGIHPAILLVMVPGVALYVAYGMQTMKPALMIDSDGIAGPGHRLSWSEVEDVSIGRRNTLIVTGAGRPVMASLSLLDTPAQTILVRIEREWGRPVEAPLATRLLNVR